MGDRQYELSLGELFDKLTVTQLRETLLCSTVYEGEIKRLEHDIDHIINDKHIVVDSRFIRIVFLLAQLNALIWSCKNMMDNGEPEYTMYLKKAHQLNGLKNQLRNKLSLIEDGLSSDLKTNIKTDNLPYHVSI